jgi:hypothetical protein
MPLVFQFQDIFPGLQARTGHQKLELDGWANPARTTILAMPESTKTCRRKRVIFSYA